MPHPIETQVYVPHEIARAAGVAEADVVSALGGAIGYIGYDEAVALGRRLRAAGLHLEVACDVQRPDVLFATTSTPLRTGPGPVPFAVSGTLHAALVSIAVILATFGVSPAALAPADADPAGPVHLVFLTEPGPGGGGGGGGRREPRPAPKAARVGSAAVSSPVPERVPPAPVVATPEPPPLPAEQFPSVAAPVIPAPADLHDRVGVLEETPASDPSRGPGSGTDNSAGGGSGGGVGAGAGSGIGPGSGGGTGGGPYRPGSGITPPRLLREVKAAYTEDARRAGVSGDVLLDIVVRHDGSVGDVRLRRGLGLGLDQQAITAVRQWRFAPATRQGAPVDVLVEVAVEFVLR
jgi:TonB family protein